MALSLIMGGLIIWRFVYDSQSAKSKKKKNATNYVFRLTDYYLFRTMRHFLRIDFGAFLDLLRSLTSLLMILTVLTFFAFGLKSASIFGYPLFIALILNSDGNAGSTRMQSEQNSSGCATVMSSLLLLGAISVPMGFAFLNDDIWMYTAGALARTVTPSIIQEVLSHLGYYAAYASILFSGVTVIGGSLLMLVSAAIVYPLRLMALVAIYQSMRQAGKLTNKLGPTKTGMLLIFVIDRILS